MRKLFGKPNPFVLFRDMRGRILLNDCIADRWIRIEKRIPSFHAFFHRFDASFDRIAEKALKLFPNFTGILLRILLVLARESKRSRDDFHRLVEFLLCFFFVSSVILVSGMASSSHNNDLNYDISTVSRLQCIHGDRFLAFLQCIYILSHLNKSFSFPQSQRIFLDHIAARHKDRPRIQLCNASSYCCL